MSEPMPNSGLKPEPETAAPLLDVNNIEVIYNHVILVLKGVSLTVREGGITALLGGNGAGKRSGSQYPHQNWSIQRWSDHHGQT